MYLLEYISCFCFIEKLLTQDLSFPPKGNKHTHTHTLIQGHHIIQFVFNFKPTSSNSDEFFLSILLTYFIYLL